MSSSLEIHEDHSPAAPKTTAWRDVLGIVASIGCAIHCAAMPMVIGFLPALGLSFLADESFHQWMAGICCLLALAAFVPGWKKHRKCLPAAFGMTGLMIISVAAFGGSDPCCEACAASVSAAEGDVSSDSGVNEDEAPCCEFCAETDEGVVAREASDAQGTNVSARSATIHLGWTPLGGLLLIAGHLLNRCFVSRCTCCATDAC